MREMIKEIFEEKNFIVKKDSCSEQEYYFCMRNKDSKFDFFVLLIVKKEEINLESFNDWSAVLINKITTENSIVGIDKNLSMVMLLEDESDDKLVNKLINKIEEDPYHFKKYVLTYTKEQTEKLSRLTLNKSIVNEIEKIVTDKEKFSEFKKMSGDMSKLKNNLYSLISKVFIKLPFLSVPIEKEELANLSEKIHNQITDNDASYLDISIQLNSSTLDLQEILQMIGVE